MFVRTWTTNVTVDTTSYFSEAKQYGVGGDEVVVVVNEARASRSSFVDPHAIGMCFVPPQLYNRWFLKYANPNSVQCSLHTPICTKPNTRDLQ